jgi:hypothetical protein
MKRRVLLERAVVSSISAVVFTATGWLMGTGSLGMGPMPPADGGCSHIATRNAYVFCNPGVGCGSHMCAWVCDGTSGTIWYGCTDEDPPCSTGYCGWENISPCDKCD